MRGKGFMFNEPAWVSGLGRFNVGKMGDGDNVFFLIFDERYLVNRSISAN